MAKKPSLTRILLSRPHRRLGYVPPLLFAMWGCLYFLFVEMLHGVGCRVEIDMCKTYDHLRLVTIGYLLSLVTSVIFGVQLFKLPYIKVLLINMIPAIMLIAFFLYYFRGLLV